MRILLDTNILIPFLDSTVPFSEACKAVATLLREGEHTIVYHPASREDLGRDKDVDRRGKILDRLAQYEELSMGPECPWNVKTTSPNDANDNTILYALARDAAHALITEDKQLLKKAITYGLDQRVYNLSGARNWLQRLHAQAELVIPHIETEDLSSLTPQLDSAFFNSLRDGYNGQFDMWFREKARAGRQAWTYMEDGKTLDAICIFAIQNNPIITDDKKALQGKTLKLCTFKVSERVRGRKLGELFLQAAFDYATNEMCEHIFIHGDLSKQEFLGAFLEDFGFKPEKELYNGDTVWVKAHPRVPPMRGSLNAYDYCKTYYPHYRWDADVNKYIVPIKARYHDDLFGYMQTVLPGFPVSGYLENTIKKAYLCNANKKKIEAGSILLFYRSGDLKSITTIGVVEMSFRSRDPGKVAVEVSRRTVYTYKEIVHLAEREVLVILFRWIKHLEKPISLETLKREQIIKGAPQSLQGLTDSKYRKFRRIIDG